MTKELELKTLYEIKELMNRCELLMKELVEAQDDYKSKYKSARKHYENQMLPEYPTEPKKPTAPVTSNNQNFRYELENEDYVTKLKSYYEEMGKYRRLIKKFEHDNRHIFETINKLVQEDLSQFIDRITFIKKQVENTKATIKEKQNILSTGTLLVDNLLWNSYIDSAIDFIIEKIKNGEANNSVEALILPQSPCYEGAISDYGRSYMTKRKQESESREAKGAKLLTMHFSNSCGGCVEGDQEICAWLDSTKQLINILTMHGVGIDLISIGGGISEGCHLGIVPYNAFYADYKHFCNSALSDYKAKSEWDAILNFEWITIYGKIDGLDFELECNGVRLRAMVSTHEEATLIKKLGSVLEDYCRQ